MEQLEVLRCSFCDVYYGENSTVAQHGHHSCPLCFTPLVLLVIEVVKLP